MRYKWYYDNGRVVISGKILRKKRLSASLLERLKSQSQEVARTSVTVYECAEAALEEIFRLANEEAKAELEQSVKGIATHPFDTSYNV